MDYARHSATKIQDAAYKKMSAVSEEDFHE